MPSTHFVGKCGGEGCSSPKTPGVSCGLHKSGFPSSPRTQEAWCYSSLLVVLSPSDSSSACAHLPHGHCIPPRRIVCTELSAVAFGNLQDSEAEAERIEVLSGAKPAATHFLRQCRYSVPPGASLNHQHQQTLIV